MITDAERAKEWRSCKALRLMINMGIPKVTNRDYVKESQESIRKCKLEADKIEMEIINNSRRITALL